MEEKIFDFEVRTTEFAKRVIRLCKATPQNAINIRLISQVVGSAGSIGANYREANDALGDKDFVHRLKISRKEAKETSHWLELIEEANPNLKPLMNEIKKESLELKNILSAMINKVNSKNKK
ncbi:MAG: four helix bundle protein [Patescibacteria group bacterium]|nr:four helix bundle protein [Patescibacteria group bacterium]MDD4610575.1 four helix bundle protein [Patescibacteria group bacterium]